MDDHDYDEHHYDEDEPDEEERSSCGAPVPA